MNRSWHLTHDHNIDLVTAHRSIGSQRSDQETYAPQWSVEQYLEQKEHRSQPTTIHERCYAQRHTSYTAKPEDNSGKMYSYSYKVCYTWLDFVHCNTHVLTVSKGKTP